MSSNRPRVPTVPTSNVIKPKAIIDMLGGDRKWDIKLTDALGQYFTVFSIDETRYQSKDLAVCSVKLGEAKVTMLINSTTICAQLMEHKDSFPLVCKVARKGKRYHFVA